jgi:hypothetical protein
MTTEGMLKPVRASRGKSAGGSPAVTQLRRPAQGGSGQGKREGFRPPSSRVAGLMPRLRRLGHIPSPPRGSQFPVRQPVATIRGPRRHANPPLVLTLTADRHLVRLVRHAPCPIRSIAAERPRACTDGGQTRPVATEQVSQ